MESGTRRVKGAAYTAAVMAACQNAPVDLAHYYDARPGTQMNGLFANLKPIAGYYAIYSWGKLAALGKPVDSDPDGSALLELEPNCIVYLSVP